MNRAIVAATLIALGSGSAFAQSPDNDEGLILGGGVGQFNVNIDDIDQTDEAIQSLDDDDTAWKAFIGWRLNPYISAEFAYIDFGAPSDTIDASGSDNNYELELSGFQPAIIGSFPLGPVELFGKLGYYFYDVDVNVDLDAPDVDSSASDEAWTYGFGVGLTFLERLHARLEYEKIDLDDVDDADAIWASGAWRF